MTVHVLGCGTLHPPSERLMTGHGALRRRATWTCTCLLVEHGAGWTLVDAGIGSADIADPQARLGPRLLRNVAPDLDPQRTALAHVVALGIDPRDVTDVALTHLDADHVGGIGDFPWAQVHVTGEQLGLLTAPTSPAVKRRLHPAQWSHGPDWRPATLNESYRGRPAARVTENVRLVALGGHVPGHAGVVVERPGSPDLLHAGDAIFSTRTLRGERRPLGLVLFEQQTRTHVAAWRASRAWLQEQYRDGVEVVCAHEPLG